MSLISKMAVKMDGVDRFKISILGISDRISDQLNVED